MRVYDFDGTIYAGESSVDFFLFTLRRHPKNLVLLPKILRMLARYRQMKVSSEELAAAIEKYAVKYLKSFTDLNAEIRDFWDRHEHKIKNFYRQNHRNDDVILSASPDFLLREIAGRLGVDTVIASQFDIEKGKLISLCYHENKCERYGAVFPDMRIDEFYTDSENDRAVFAISDRVFMVNGNKITERT